MAAFFSLTRTVFGFALLGPLTDPLTVTTLTEVEVSTTDEDTATAPPAFRTKKRHNLSYKLERKLLKNGNRFPSYQPFVNAFLEIRRCKLYVKADVFCERFQFINFVMRGFPRNIHHQDCSSEVLTKQNQVNSRVFNGLPHGVLEKEQLLKIEIQRFRLSSL